MRPISTAILLIMLTFAGAHLVQASPSDTVSFKNFVFPELKVPADVRVSAHELPRRLVISDGKIIRDEYLQSEILDHEEDLPSTYCILNVLYQSAAPLPTGELTIPAAKYSNLVAAIQEGLSSLNPAEAGGSSDLTTATFYSELRAVNREFDFARAKTVIAKTPVDFIPSSIGCQTKLPLQKAAAVKQSQLIQTVFGGLISVKSRQ